MGGFRPPLEAELTSAMKSMNIEIDRSKTKAVIYKDLGATT